MLTGLQYIHSDLRTASEAAVTGQEHCRADLEGRGVVDRIGRLEVVLSAESGGSLDHWRADIGQDQFDAGEEHFELR